MDSEGRLADQVLEVQRGCPLPGGTFTTETWEIVLPQTRSFSPFSLKSPSMLVIDQTHRMLKAGGQVEKRGG